MTDDRDPNTSNETQAQSKTDKHGATYIAVGALGLIILLIVVQMSC